MGTECGTQSWRQRACDIRFLQNIRTRQAYSTITKMDAPRSYENVGKPLKDYTVLQSGRPYSREVFTEYSSVSTLKKPDVPFFRAACSLQARDSTTDATLRDCLVTRPFHLHVNTL